LVANKDLLFYRQGEEYLPQTIRDTFSVLFGVAQIGDIEAEANRRAAQRELSIAKKELKAAEESESALDSRRIALLAEARFAGISVAATSTELAGDNDLFNSLRQVLAWRPSSVPYLERDRSLASKPRRLSLRGEGRRLQDQIAAAQRYSAGASEFELEANEQRSRLESINALPRKANGAWQWPFLKEADARMDSIAEALLQELKSLDRDLENVTGTRPRLEEHLASLTRQASEVSEQVRQVETELSAAILSEERATAQEDANTRAARVQGRISFFLDSAETSDTVPELRLKVERLKTKVGPLDQSWWFGR
jgi:phage shock protein A